MVDGIRTILQSADVAVTFSQPMEIKTVYHTSRGTVG